MARADSIGLFWQDMPKVGARAKGEARQRPMPPIPDTGWKSPTTFPNLSAATVIGVDTETWDPELLTAGPGWGRGKGHIVGVSLSVQDGTSWYFPIRHETEPEYNLDPATTLRWLDHVLCGNQPKVGANLIYDLGWLTWEGVRVGGTMYDIQFAEALLNSETPDVTLEALSHKYLGVGKVTDSLYEWLSRWQGGKPNDKQRKHLHITPPRLAGPYAEGDAQYPIKILEKQWPELVRRGVLDLYHMECQLIPLLVKMRLKGAPVDVPRAEALYQELDVDAATVAQQLRHIAGQEVNPNAKDSLTSAFKKLSIDIPTKIDKKSGKERVTFDAAALELIDHPLAAAVLEHRRIMKVQNTFVKGYILDKNVNGRIYCSFHPLKGEGRGARSGRFASSDPNLQNIPVRTAIGKRVREAFVASPGGRWRKWDYSQIEYRLLAHHAVGEGAEHLRAIYNADPNTDYHEVTIDLIRKLTGIILERRPAKNINFGLIYGMSEFKLSRDLGLTPAKGKELFRNYHAAAPFARATMDDAANEVHRLGYVTTLLGRKSDFNMWGPKDYGAERTMYSYDIACRKWGPYNIERAMTHKALNRKLQGGAADVMKKAMVTAYHAGLFEDSACGMPSLTVHDELDFDDTTDPDNPAWKEFENIMNTSVPGLRVPILIDGSVGPNWGRAD